MTIPTPEEITDGERRTQAIRADLVESAKEAEREAESMEARARLLRDEARRARAAAKALAS